MRLWRICRQAFADLSGDGARLYGGRWNSPGFPVVYSADSAALAVLEMRVHFDLSWDLLPDDYVLLEIETGAAAPDRSEHVDNERSHGDAWLSSLRTPLLSVPSAIVPESRNVLINPTHPDATSIKVVATRPFGFDQRLWLPRIQQDNAL